MELLLIAVLMAFAVSVDNFVISLSFGLSFPKIKNSTILKTSLFFSLASFLLYMAGMKIGVYIETFLEHDHYFAAAFLFFIGIKMIKSALGKKKEKINPETLLNWKMLTLFSLATSMDAFVIGMTSSLSKNISVLYTAAAVPAVVFLATFIGLKTGKELGSKKAKTMQIAGGIILIGLGVKVLISG